ncbi:MAG: M23 family metallopeptidase [Verrucomicrobia bacterium]|nr:M23 family metallopeptidase [Verrucomicrobiota bacterium]
MREAGNVTDQARNVGMDVPLPIRGTWRRAGCLLVLMIVSTWSLKSAENAPLFRLPTPNRAIFEPGGESRFFAPTAGKLWPSGTFGCVRTDGRQLHEGIDILFTQTDRRGEPTDPVTAVADGSVVYVNRKSGLSNYGLYVVVRHQTSGLTIQTLYAHLATIGPGVQVGARVAAGQLIGKLGRTTNTRSSISKDRAHLHLEFNFQLNPSYAQWHARHRVGERNDHGNWNGRNLLGVDPWKLYMEQQRLGSRFDLVKWIRSSPEVCRVFVRDSDFPWIKANPAFVRPNPRANKEGVAGFEIALDFMGVPMECTPRAASEMKRLVSNQVLYVNEAELSQHPCRRWVTKSGKGWVLSTAGLELMSLLTF